MRRRIPWRSLRLYLVTALAGLLLGWLLVTFVLLPGERTTGSVSTPALVGRSLEEARHILDSVGLKFSLGDERASATVPANAVLSQSPAPGTRQRRLAAVRVDVSAGPRRVRVPGVAGLALDQARRILTDSGLSAGPARDEASDRPRGEVLRTRPDAGRFVGEGAVVDLIVSTGPAEITMPDVIGRPPGDAIGLLRQLGLTRIQVDSADGERGVVIAQSPEAGAGIQRSNLVRLRVGNRS